MGIDTSRPAEDGDAGGADASTPRPGAAPDLPTPGGDSPDRRDLPEPGGILLSDAAQILAFGGATFLLYLALERLPLMGGVIGVLGAVVGLFSPAPAIQVFLRWGTGAGSGVIFGVAVALAWAEGWEISLQFLASIGVIVWLLAASISAGRPIERAVGVSILGAAVGLGVLYAVLTLGGDGGGLSVLLGPEGEKVLRRFSGGAAGAQQEEINRLIRIMGHLIPAFAVMQATLTSLLNYMLLRHVWTLRGAGGLFPARDLGRWSMAEPAVWALIGSAGLLYFLRGTSMAWVMGNVLLILLFGYFLQGIAVTHFLLRKTGVAVVYRIPLCFFALTFSYVVAALGLFDLWFDFRRIRTAAPSADKEGG